MPRSSSGEFQVVLSPWVPVNTPPSGGPTSSPKMSVTPSRVSPTCSAIRIAWIIVAMSGVLPGEHVVEDRVRLGRRLGAHALRRLAELPGVAIAQLVDLRARQQRARAQLALEPIEAVELVLDRVRAARRRVAAQPGHHRLEQVRLALAPHVR